MYVRVAVSNADMLAALQAALLAIVEGGQQSYSIGLPGGGTRTYTSLDLDKLQKAIEFYEAKVNRATRRTFAAVSFRECG